MEFSAQMSEHNGAFIYSEARLGEVTNWPRKFAKKLRDDLLERDRDWRLEHGAVRLNLEGLKRLWKKTRAPALRDLASLIEPVTAREAINLPPLNAPRRMRVTAIPINPFIVLAQDQLRQDYSVRVAKNEVFCVGLEISAEPDPTHPGIWRVVGPVPRWPGDRAYQPSSSPPNAARNGNGASHQPLL
jgi:hypothetical protein